ncbi:MAG: hypothetical protein IKJ69_04095 [Clostridia bacterium]|nr:hypothetical protein [Clostridia bacterium]
MKKLFQKKTTNNSSATNKTKKDKQTKAEKRQLKTEKKKQLKESKKQLKAARKHLKTEKKKQSKVVGKSEYEMICDIALNRAIGSNGCLTETLNQLLDDFDAETNPITVEQAEEIIGVLLQKAVVVRSDMMDTFVETAKDGETAMKYRRKLNNIHSLISKCDISNNRVQTATNEYNDYINLKR